MINLDSGVGEKNPIPTPTVLKESDSTQLPPTPRPCWWPVCTWKSSPYFQDWILQDKLLHLKAFIRHLDIGCHGENGPVFRVGVVGFCHVSLLHNKRLFGSQFSIALLKMFEETM